MLSVYSSLGQQDRSMKILAVIILFISAVAAVENLAGLPVERFQQVKRILSVTAKSSKRDSSAGLGGHLRNVHDVLEDNELPNEAAEVIPGENQEEKEAVANMTNASHTVMLAIQELKKVRDSDSKRHAQQFVGALKYLDDDNHVKAVLGSHLIEMHLNCNHIKLEFAKRVKKAGLLNQLGPDSLDFTEIMAKVLKEAEGGLVDVFEEFVNKAREHGIHYDPGVIVIKVIGSLVSEAACDMKMDGLVKAIIEEIEEGDPEGGFRESLDDKIIDSIYSKKNRRCSGRFLDSLKATGKGLKERMISLIFERCKELQLVRYGVETVLDAIRLGRKAEALKNLSDLRQKVFAQKVQEFMKTKQFDQAFDEVGDFVLNEIRRAILVNFATQKLLQRKP